MKKTMLLFPPQWIPLSPPLALPSLSAVLRQHNYTVTPIDANIEFYDHILSRDFIKQCKETVDEFRTKYNLFDPTIKLNLFTEEVINRFNVTHNMIMEIGDVWDSIEEKTAESLNILRSEDFYNPLMLAEAVFYLKYSLLAVGLAYFPSDILLNYYSNFNYKLSIDSIKQATEDVTGNIFLKYYEDKLHHRIKEENPDFIGLSIGCNTQLVAGFTFARKIKQAFPHIHINIGGNSFTRLIDVLENKPEMFDLFADSFIIGEGEQALLDLLDALSHNNDISAIPGVVCRKDNTVIVNEPSTVNIKDLPTPDFDGLDLSLYLSPEPIFPLQSARGCYWRKCSFCDHDFGNAYSIKPVSKIVSEIEALKNKYDANHFYFVDEAISPNYVKNLSAELLNRNLDINWYTCARAEKTFTPDITELAHKAGLKLLLWGIESGNERVLSLINKGNTPSEALVALKNTAAAGIWNHCFFFFGFPSETTEEAMQTINYIIDNKDVIHSYGFGPFALGKYSKIAANPEKYHIDHIEPSEELSTATGDFTTTQGMTRAQVDNFVEMYTNTCTEQYGFPLWMSIGGYKEHIFLYLSRYDTQILRLKPEETVEKFGSQV